MRTAIMVFAGLLFSFSLIYFARPISEWMVETFAGDTLPKRKVLAEVVRIEGPAFFRRANRARFFPLDESTNFSAKDEVKTEKGGRVHLKMSSGYEIELLPESQMIFDWWSKDTGPEYFSLTRGHFRLLKQGKVGALYVVKGSEVFLPERAPNNQSLARSVISSGVKSRSPRLRERPEELPNEAETPGLIVNAAGEASVGLLDSTTTLTSAYIESVFASRSNLFRRCQLSSLRDGESAIGDLLFSLVIGNDGKVTDVRMVSSDFKSKGLESCVLEVVERTKFKSFAGDPVQLSYPLNFR